MPPATTSQAPNPVKCPVTCAVKHLMHFEGGHALSAFRAQALLPRLQALNACISGLVARHVHWVWADAPITEPGPLAALLHYGDAYAGDCEGTLVVVMPRLGTVSPWASKATDIARNCGLAIHRVERVTEYRLNSKPGCWTACWARSPSRCPLPSCKPSRRCCMTA